MRRKCLGILFPVGRVSAVQTVPLTKGGLVQGPTQCALNVLCWNSQLLNGFLGTQHSDSGPKG